MGAARREGLDTHGIGNARDMSAWAEWSGVDFKDKSHVGAGHKFCRPIEDLPMDKSRVCPISADAKRRFAEAQKG